MRTIKVTTTIELTTKQKSAIENKFSDKNSTKATSVATKGSTAKSSEGEVEFVYEINPNIIGGILVVDGDKYYDNTILGRLNLMKKQLA